ncbi:MAG: GTP cyclohydrolase I [Polyangiaceae bacterium]|nr:GTP cyclohydrolase I [Polyangiaceae bacterium]
MPGVDREGVARAVADFLRALGREPVGPLADTPALVAAAWCDELLDGEGLDPAAILREGSCAAEGDPGLVVLRGLRAETMCPHHLLPAHGEATVAYLPGTRLAGFGAVARALSACTHRLAFQEHAGASLAGALVSGLGARGALCQLRLTHTCLALRGARETAARVETLATAGSFAPGGPDRALALALLGAPGAAAEAR